MKSVLVLFMVAALAVVSQAVVIDSFVNLDFDSGATTSWPFKGFDAPDSTEIEGWTNYPAGPLNDAGVEAADVGWWLSGYGDVNAAFMSSGDAAYNMSSYTIQAGDVFTIGYTAQYWGWTGTGEWTATLFYDDPANVIGTYVNNLGDVTWWTAYSDATGIAATPASVGGTLGILMQNTGTGIANIDEVTVNVVPEPATLSLLGLGALVMLRKRK